MVKVKHVKIEDYEIDDPTWWCQYYKGSVGVLCVRIEQYLVEEDEDRKETLEMLLRVLIDNFNEKGIGIVVPYDGEKGEKEGK
jgi:hypothetical protein|tara:strand:- start:244 stop:492 length:249 start_codon:yes stop_codon:yes gene_type:complete